MFGLHLSLLRVRCRNVRGTPSIISDLWKNIVGGSMFPITTEGIASQEISKLQQRKYKLDRRKNFLTLLDEGNVFSKQDMKSLSQQTWRIAEILFRERWKACTSRIYKINSASITSMVAYGATVASGLTLALFLLLFVCPSHLMLLCSLLTTSTFFFTLFIF